MASYRDLDIYLLARENTRDVIRLTASGVAFGDLADQIQRSASSVQNLIAEGHGYGSDRMFIDYLRRARGSNNEVQAQIDTLEDLGLITPDHPLHARLERCGRGITSLIQYLRRRQR